MRNKITVASVVAVLLIGVALWSRLNSDEATYPQVVVVDSEIDELIYQDAIEVFTAPPTKENTSPEKPLNNTELVSRQLLLDYINLATSGRATESSIESLANRYIESIPTIHKSKQVSVTEIKIVPNTRANFQKYADEITKIHQSYTQEIEKAQNKEFSLNVLDSGLFSLSLAFSEAYNNASSKLIDMGVPASLTERHLELINRYLSSASAMKSISEAEQDTASAFAGLIVLNNNLNEESLILEQISQILTSNGI